MWRYRIFLTLIAPVLAGVALWRLSRSTETCGDLAERLGASAGAPGAIWLHGASNGELTSARHLVEALLTAFPGQPLIITTNTTSARALVKGWGLPRVTARLAPLDFCWTLSRFRFAWRPQALIVLENEFWPNRIVCAKAPVICVGARMSERSSRNWLRAGRFVGHMMRHISYLSPQDAASGERFRALGLPADRIGPVATLKSSVTLPTPPPDSLVALQKVFDRAATVLAASTHEGEEAIVLEAFQTARYTRPDLKLILAPRHPRRGDEVATLIARTGLNWARRSTGADTASGTAIYLADTLGEMPLWYTLAGVTFIGGSLTPRGGHTPFEPAHFGSTILHGPDVANFADAYAVLDTGGGATRVEDTSHLSKAILRLGTAKARQSQASRATDILEALDTGVDAVAHVVNVVKNVIPA